MPKDHKSPSPQTTHPRPPLALHKIGVAEEELNEELDDDSSDISTEEELSFSSDELKSSILEQLDCIFPSFEFSNEPATLSFEQASIASMNIPI